MYKSLSIDQVKQVMRPLDILLFKGGDGVSGCIGKCQKKETGNGDFSHASLVMNSQLLDKSRIEGIEDDVWYVWEITMSGDWNDGVTDIYGKSRLCVQLRKFDDVVSAVFKNDKCRCAWVPLRNHPLLVDDDLIKDALKKKCTDICLETYGRKYERSPLVLLAALMPCLRKCIGTKGIERFFCSEFVAWVLKEVGVMPQVQEEYVMPVDFIPDVDRDGHSGVTGTDSPVLIIQSEKV